MPAEYLQNMSVVLLSGRRQVTISHGKVVEYGDNSRFKTSSLPFPFVLRAAARCVSSRRVLGKCRDAVIRSNLQDGRNLCVFKPDPHAPNPSRRPASDKARGCPLESGDV